MDRAGDVSWLLADRGIEWLEVPARWIFVGEYAMDWFIALTLVRQSDIPLGPGKAYLLFATFLLFCTKGGPLATSSSLSSSAISAQVAVLVMAFPLCESFFSNLEIQ